MRCSVLLAFVVSAFLACALGAPVPASSHDLNIIGREIEHAPFVGMDEVAREPEPEPDATEEARGCKMYSCICYLPTFMDARLLCSAVINLYPYRPN
ncbi:hypothetical protein C8R46DRAFT_1356528 [Mycena filopes]|nr:hypothetical protein C8R46DRAFT_1356528 [Mycena filopes]